MSIREEIIQNLIDAKIASPRLECDIILHKAMPNYPQYTEKEKENALQMLEKRKNHMPIDKIIGKRDFYKYTFIVNEDVLTPRPDTEILVENAINLLKDKSTANILDLGVGSGCILLSILKENKLYQGIGVDKSIKALKVAKQNANSLGLENQVTFVNDSWENKNFVDGKFDIIVSNPPYIPSKEILELEEDVKKYDPLTALDGGYDGLDCYKAIAKVVYDLLKEDAYLLLEVGYNQAQDVIDIFTSFANLKFVKIVKDLAGIDRCIIFKK